MKQKKKLRLFECFVTPENERQKRALSENRRTTFWFIVKSLIGIDLGLESERKRMKEYEKQEIEKL